MPEAQKKRQVSGLHGAPPWDHSPTPPLSLLRQTLEQQPDLLGRLKAGHVQNLLPMALDALTVAETEAANWEEAAHKLATELAELQQVAADDERRRQVKREYQADFRAGLRGSRAARAALRRGPQ